MIILKLKIPQMQISYLTFVFLFAGTIRFLYTDTSQRQESLKMSPRLNVA